MVFLALISFGVIAFRPSGNVADMHMWTFSRAHERIYAPMLDRWNEVGDQPTVDLSVMSLEALSQRLMTSFTTGVRSADLVEVERRASEFAFAGPLETVGFVDLTDRIRDAGLLDRLSPPSLSPWTREGRIFGLPHDVHPMLLCYRRDLVEAAGIDVSRIETWDDFELLMRPVMDPDDDGEVDHYLIAFWPNGPYRDQLEALLLQAGGGPFSRAGELDFDRPVNARVLARLVRWCAGPDRIAADVPEFTAEGNALRTSGRAISGLMPDWLSDLWRNDMPSMAGKYRLMPLPAWEPGGRRTSVWGGTMLGISRDAPDIEAAWEFARDLYLAEHTARELWATGSMITPVRDYWDDPIYDEPDPFYSGQAIGRLFIEYAEEVPPRPAHPFTARAVERLQGVLVDLWVWAQEREIYDAGQLESKALELLAAAEPGALREMSRNTFVANDN
jgi:arabinosaccharide transport system substrate-binding protein